MSRGTLSFTLVSASFTPHVSFDSEPCDTYATLRCGKERFVTKTAEDHGRLPVWNDTFTFNIEEENLSNDLSIQVFDANNEAPELLGLAKIPVRNMIGKEEATLTVLISPDKGETGKLKAVWKWNPSSEYSPGSNASAVYEYSVNKGSKQDKYEHLDILSDALAKLSTDKKSATQMIDSASQKVGVAEFASPPNPTYPTIKDSDPSVSGYPAPPSSSPPPPPPSAPEYPWNQDSYPNYQNPNYEQDEATAHPPYPSAPGSERERYSASPTFVQSYPPPSDVSDKLYSSQSTDVSYPQLYPPQANMNNPLPSDARYPPSYPPQGCVPNLPSTDASFPSSYPPLQNANYAPSYPPLPDGGYPPSHPSITYPPSQYSPSETTYPPSYPTQPEVAYPPSYQEASYPYSGGGMVPPPVSYSRGLDKDKKDKDKKDKDKKDKDKKDKDKHKVQDSYTPYGQSSYPAYPSQYPSPAGYPPYPDKKDKDKKDKKDKDKKDKDKKDKDKHKVLDPYASYGQYPYPAYPPQYPPPPGYPPHGHYPPPPQGHYPPPPQGHGPPPPQGHAPGAGFGYPPTVQNYPPPHGYPPGPTNCPPPYGYPPQGYSNTQGYQSNQYPPPPVYPPAGYPPPSQPHYSG